MLKINAGAQVIANYSENGHVTKDTLAPDGLPHPGTYSWYLSSGNMATLGDAYAANVIDTGNFDDGQCAEDAMKGRAGPRQCQSIFTVPNDLSSGQYMLVWLWRFPKVEGVVEMYSSCMDITVTSTTTQTMTETVVSTISETADDVAEAASSVITNVAAAVMPIEDPSSQSTSSQRTLTSTIYETTRVYTTLPHVDEPTTSVHRLGDLMGAMTGASPLSTRTTTLDAAPTTDAHGDSVIVHTIIEEQQQNPLADANNMESVTVLVTEIVGPATITPAVNTDRSAGTVTSPAIDATPTLSMDIIVSTLVQELQPNPLEDANNIVWAKTVVTKFVDEFSRTVLPPATITSSFVDSVPVMVQKAQQDVSEELHTTETRTTFVTKTSAAPSSTTTTAEGAIVTTSVSAGATTAITTIDDMPGVEISMMRDEDVVVAVVMVYATAYVTVTASP